MTRKYFAFALASLLSGCATVVDYTVYTDPPFATLYSLTNNQNLGVSPLSTSVTFTDEDVKRGYKSFNGVEARWRSGATSKVPVISIRLDQGSEQNMTISRTNSPGREIDIQHADQMRRELIGLYGTLLKQKSEDARTAAYEARTKAMREAEEQKQLQNNRSYNCTSSRSGDSIYTNCN
jgi:hypothetical protein